MKCNILIRSLFLALLIDIVSCSPYVTVLPEDPAVVVIPDAPGPDHIWIQGTWQWNRSARSYRWTDGYWLPGGRHKVWVEGHWVQARRGWRYAPGHWR